MKRTDCAREQIKRKSFGVLFTTFPDTLRAFRLLRAWQRRALLRCGSDQGCWKSKRLRRIRSLRLCEGNRYIVGGKGQHRRDEKADSSGGHAEQQRLCRDVDVVHCAHPRESPAKVTAPSGPTLAFNSSASLAILLAIRRVFEVGGTPWTASARWKYSARDARSAKG